jgi:hypothetical protein
MLNPLNFSILDTRVFDKKDQAFRTLLLLHITSLSSYLHIYNISWVYLSPSPYLTTTQTLPSNHPHLAANSFPTHFSNPPCAIISCTFGGNSPTLCFHSSPPSPSLIIT